MSEGIRKGKQAVPRSMFFKTVLNRILAYAMSIVILYTLGPLDDVVNSGFSIFKVCQPGWFPIKHYR
jgi:choline transport protein